MSCAENPIDDVEFSPLETCHHLRQEVRPLLWEVFSSNDADCIAQLGNKNKVKATATYSQTIVEMLNRPSKNVRLQVKFCTMAFKSFKS